MDSSQNDNDNSSSSSSYGSDDTNNSNQSSSSNSNNNNDSNSNNDNNNDDNGSNINSNSNNNNNSNNDSSNNNNNDNNYNNNSGNNNDNSDNNNNNNGEISSSSSNNNNNDNNNNNNGGDSNSSNYNNDSPSKNKSNSQSSPSPPSSSKGSYSTSQPSLSDGSSPSHDNASLIAGTVVGVGIFLLLFILCCVVCCKKKKKKSDTMQYYGNPSQRGPHQQYGSTNYAGAAGMPSTQWGQGMRPAVPPSANYSSGPVGPALPPPHPSVALGFSKSTFTYEELAAATNGFSKERLLGEGGFGYVHKGVLPNGKEIAVKSLKSGSGQGEREFQAEVEIISRVHHRHLVSLVGYCIAGAQRMLVYEFVPNNTLEFHLHGKGRPPMDFAMRMKIALGSAKGLAYLHEDCHPKIIHRDIKTANILIDNAYEGKVADFGLAKLSSDTYTHVSTRVMGTFGYLAPEYAASGKLTEKSDVFSFGVMLLELVTGRRPIDPYAEEEDCLVDWARPYIGRALDERIFDGFVDPRLEGEFDPEEMMRLIACAGASIRHSAKRRPKMSQIVRALEGDVSLEDLKEGPKARSGSTLSTSGGSSEYDTSSYNSDMKRFRQTTLSSTEYPSSEYGHTSNSSGEFSSKFTSPGPARNFL